jgi:hypothetical protein
MQNISWIAFAVSNTLTKSVMHFFPASNTTNAPYPVIYNVRLFGKEIGEKTITLDDGRLGQPDGVRLEDIFPVLNDSPVGLMALSVDLTISQPKVDISASSCVIEIITASNSVRYFAQQAYVENKKQARGMLAVNDAYNLSSLLVVNCNEKALKPDLLILDQKSSELHFNREGLPEIEVNSAFEYSFEEKSYNTVVPQECSWGLFRSSSVSLAETLPPNTAAYAVYRDTLTKRIVSVKAI